MSETDLSRRSILKGIPVAAVATCTVLPVVAQTDPIFAAIERHKEAYKAFYKCEDMTPEEIAEEDAACEQLLTTVPTSKEGIRAALEWLVKYDTGMIPDTSGKFLPTLLKSPALTQGGANV